MNTRLIKHISSRCGGGRGFLLGLLLIASTLLPSIAKGEEIFAELAKQKQVESTFVSGRFAKNMSSWRSMSGERGFNFGNKFSSLFTYQCYSEATVKLARRILDSYVSKHKNVELMMRSTEHGSEYMVYEEFDKDDKLIRVLIWNSDGPNICEVVEVEWKDGFVRDSSYIDSYGYSIEFPELASLKDLDQLLQPKTWEGLGKFCEREVLKALKLEEYE